MFDIFWKREKGLDDFVCWLTKPEGAAEMGATFWLDVRLPGVGPVGWKYSRLHVRDE